MKNQISFFHIFFNNDFIKQVENVEVGKDVEETLNQLTVDARKREELNKIKTTKQMEDL